MEGSTPLEDLAAKLAAIGELDPDMSIITGPAPQLKPPAIVLRPDNPWLVPKGYCQDEQRYVAIPVVTASTPADGVRKIYLAVLAIKNALTDAWSWESVSAPLIDETTGVPLLAASVRLKYMSSEEEEALS